MAAPSPVAAAIRLILPRLLPSRVRERLVARVQSLTEAVTDQRDFARAEDIRALGPHLTHARTALDELGSELASLRVELDDLRRVAADRPPAALPAVTITALRHAEVDMLNDGIGAASTALVRLRETADALERPTPSAEPTASPKAELKLCHVDGCDRPIRARGLCGKHYQEWRRGKLPDVIS